MQRRDGSTAIRRVFNAWWQVGSEAGRIQVISMYQTYKTTPDAGDPLTQCIAFIKALAATE